MAVPARRYLDFIDTFSTHWGLVNTALGSALTLSGGYVVASLGTNRASLVTAITAVETAINSHEGAAGDRDVLRPALRERIRQFKKLVEGAFPTNLHLINKLPSAPGINSASGVWMKAMADVAEIWAEINALEAGAGDPVPLILTGGYTRASFVTDQGSLNTTFTAVQNAMITVQERIDARDAVWKPIYERLKQYRLQVQGRFATGSALLSSLPSLTPAPGHTPTAVNVSAVWDAGTSKAVVTYTSSTDPLLSQYELRACFGGTKYSTDTESVIGSHAAGTVTPFATDEGLVASGSKVWYKVYVMLSSGNEKGSRAIAVTRP